MDFLLANALCNTKSGLVSPYIFSVFPGASSVPGAVHYKRGFSPGFSIYVNFPNLWDTKK